MRRGKFRAQLGLEKTVVKSDEDMERNGIIKNCKKLWCHRKPWLLCFTFICLYSLYAFHLKMKARGINKGYNSAKALKRYESLKSSGVNEGYNIAKAFKPPNRLEPVNHAYITLWLHQVHQWFAPDDHITTASKVEDFLIAAKKVGFTQLMFDVSWAWTERDSEGDIQIDSYNKEDVMSEACKMGLSLHVLLTMREFPPWLEEKASENKSMFDIGCSCLNFPPLGTNPSIANKEVWKYATNFVSKTSHLLLKKYGRCIESISPTFNNEFETRYTQTHNLMRDYSDQSIANYKQWQFEKGLTSSLEESNSPPNFPCASTCEPILDKNISNWLGFREEFLSERYIELCRIAKNSEARESDGKLYKPSCLLHFGEMFSSTDALNSNLFFKMAKSEFVDQVVMDSNMALFGAPTSPSIVGILVSAAQAYGKSIHYEAATERILICDENGKPQRNNEMKGGEHGVSLLLRSGISRGLEAGVHSIGVTNLCAPGELEDLLFSSSHHDKTVKRDMIQEKRKGILLERASSFNPTAVIFVPYRAFYAFNFLISGATCRTRHTPCWHESFKHIPRFAYGKLTSPDTCSVDIAQQALIELWDSMRTRHSQVSVIVDPEKLTSDLLEMTSERTLLSFPCVMTNSKWNFFEGEKFLASFQEKNQKYPFTEFIAKMPYSCTN